MLSPEQAKGLRAFLRDETGWPEGPVQAQIDDALAWHEDGPGGAWLSVNECQIVLQAGADQIGGHAYSIREHLREKLERGATMADHGNPSEGDETTGAP